MPTKRTCTVQRVGHKGKTVNFDLTSRQAMNMVARIAKCAALRIRGEVVRVTIWPKGTVTVWNAGPRQ